MHADIERQPPRPGRFDAVQIQHIGAVQRREVAGFADLGHQRFQHLVAQATHGAVVQRV